MIQCALMLPICRPSNPGSRSTKDLAFVQCVDGREPLIHEVWSQGLYNITCKVHPTALVQVIAGTVGEFATNYLTENGRRFQIIRQLSINGSVQLLGVPAQAWTRGLPFILQPVGYH